MNKTAKFTIILMVSTVLSKLLGFGRELALAYQYGASNISDAYIIAFSIPTVIFAGIGTAILTCYIPMYSQIEERAPRQLARFNHNITTIVVLLSAIILGVFWLFEGQIVRLFAVGFDEATLGFAIELTRIMMISIIFIGISNIMQGYLQIKGSFLAIGLISMPLNLFVIASILLSGNANTSVLSWGLVAGYGAAMLMLALVATTKGFNYRPCLSFKDTNVRRLLMLVMPVFLGRTIMQINLMIDRTLASTLSEGVVSALNYANKIFGFVISVFVLSLVTAIFPKLSKENAQNNHTALKRTTTSSMGMVMLFVIPIAAGLIIFSKEIVTIMFGRGAFDAEDITMTAQALAFYSTGLVFYSVKDILNNVFYSIQDSKTPTINSVITVVLNISLNLLLIKVMGHMGLALATSVSSGITMFLLIFALRKKVGKMGFGRLLVSAVKMLIAGGLMAVAALFIHRWTAGLVTMEGTIGLLIPFISAVGAGAIVYFIALIFMKTKEIGDLVVEAGRFFTRKQRKRR